MNFRPVILLVALFTASAVAQDKIRITRLDELPRYTYTVDVRAAEFLGNPDAARRLAAEVRADLLQDLETFEIADVTTLKSYYEALAMIATIDERWDDYLEYFELLQGLEDKEATRLVATVYMPAYIAAVREGGDFRAALERESATRLGGLPYDVVGDDIKQLKALSEILSPALLQGSVEASVQPVLDGSNGEVSKELALQMLSSYQVLKYVVPYSDVTVSVYAAYLDAHAVAKPDIWADREFALAADAGHEPVVVAIWDSGLDADIFVAGGQAWSNAAETPGNGMDDDSNGYVDDVHGIAYDLHAYKVPELLYPIGDIDDVRSRLERQAKGFSDLQANIDSAEAGEMRAAFRSLAPADVQPFMEGLQEYSNYAHGTHVAGIAARGNPYALLLGARMTFDHRSIPELPTLELARREADMIRDIVRYFQANGVRVVNMSWGGTQAAIESALEANNAGGSAEERQALAREIFEIFRDSMTTAIREAPEILFVCGAGNANSDAEFEEFVPSSLRLPNILSVGAVDQAGDETSFTSFGKVDVYASGFQVESFVPGGNSVAFSGTSMSSPNVVNLAAKLLAVNPELTPTQVAGLIVAGADATYAGDRLVLLSNPQRSLAMLEARQ